MKKSLPPYVYKKTVKGRDYFYFDHAGVRERVDPAAPDFWQTYSDLKKTKPVFKGSRTWANLVQLYKKSPGWLNLKPRTKADYDRVIAKILANMGSKSVAGLRKPNVMAIRDEEGGRSGTYLVQILSILSEFAISQEWRKDNPASGLDAAHIAKKAPHEPWPDKAVMKFRERADPLPKLIFAVGLGSVQRPGDWVRFNWEDFDGRNLDLTQGKTDKRLIVPLPDWVVAIIEESRPRVRNINGTPLIANRGKRMTYRRMAEIMLSERVRLGLTKYDLHALRYRGVMELAWGGCTDDEICSFSGHASRRMVEKYAGDARQIMRAQQAAEKRMNL